MQQDATFRPSPALPPPSNLVGPVAWIRANLFSSWSNSLLTLVCLWLTWTVVSSVASWGLINAVWSGDDGAPCRVAGTGACWAFVKAKFSQFLYGRYPAAERWRVDLVYVLFAIGIVPLLIPRIPKKAWSIYFTLVLFPILAYWLLTGNEWHPSPTQYAQFSTQEMKDDARAELAGRLMPPSQYADWHKGMPDAERQKLVPPPLAAADYAKWYGESYAKISTGQKLWLAVYGLLAPALLLASALFFAASFLAPHVMMPQSAKLAAGLLFTLALPFALEWLFGTLYTSPVAGVGPLKMPIVKTELWGGMLVTMVVATVGITCSFPIGIVLALGRRSRMPIARWASVGFIEFVRGVPLITVLFMASVMLPLFLPEGVTFDKLLRVLVGVSLFSGAYMAETIRGGLQAIPRGQFEAADALGLSYPKKMGLIVLPQALKLVIPGIVNSFVGLFKDTSLVLIIGMFDLLGIVQLNLSDPKWAAPTIVLTAYAFVGLFFWVCCFGMTRYSAWLEKWLAAGERK